MNGTFWSLVPALVAIILALITKEVYSSLFCGIIIGGLFYTNFNVVATLNHILGNGEGEYGLIKVLSDPYNVGILIFLVILGSLVSLMNKSGGSKSFGDFASKNINSRAGTMLATMLLGVIIFIDDYFNCLTVGSVMRTCSDKQKISREKLAYLIDATAAPVCIIAPISSWAAAVSGFVENENGIDLFIRAIPYNYYAILTIAMLIIISIMQVDFGPMKKFEQDAISNNYKTKDEPYIEDEVIGNGKVIDLVVPIIALVVFCVIGMIYSGGFFGAEKVSFIDAFANSDASVGLVIGSVVAIIFTIFFYTIRRTLSFNNCMASLVDGFKNMAPAILILSFAWTLKSMTDSLGAKEFVNAIVGQNIDRFYMFIPSLVFLIGAFISFSTGTSWGTFGILIPIVVSVFSYDPKLQIIAISACMAGSVFGDHCSPISDTTIMSSAGAQCEHINHVKTQLPYASLVAVISFFVYILASLVQHPVVPLFAGIVILFVVLKMMATKNT